MERAFLIAIYGFFFIYQIKNKKSPEGLISKTLGGALK
jgi:hypothetical protein